MLFLELNMVKNLTVSELHDFTEQIAYQYEYGWGEALEYHNFKTQNSDHITVRLYHSDIKFATGMVFEQWMRKSKPEIVGSIHRKGKRASVPFAERRGIFGKS